jgi:hypothetical protein
VGEDALGLLGRDETIADPARRLDAEAAREALGHAASPIATLAPAGLSPAEISSYCPSMLDLLCRPLTPSENAM